MRAGKCECLWRGAGGEVAQVGYLRGACSRASPDTCFIPAYLPPLTTSSFSSFLITPPSFLTPPSPHTSLPSPPPLPPFNDPRSRRKGVRVRSEGWRSKRADGDRTDEREEADDTVIMFPSTNTYPHTSIYST